MKIYHYHYICTECHIDEAQDEPCELEMTLDAPLAYDPTECPFGMDAAEWERVGAEDDN